LGLARGPRPWGDRPCPKPGKHAQQTGWEARKALGPSDALAREWQCQFLDLGSNSLSGPVPPQLFHPASRLISADLSRNQLSGPVPSPANTSAGATRASRISVLNLSGNRLTGMLPLELFRVYLAYFDASNNDLEGPVAPLLRTCWALNYLELSDNRLDGAIPGELAAQNMHVGGGGVWDGGRG
ncbi:putative inactive receptor kinase At5g10020-like protein, partial [Tetrabaena socialis]